MPLTPNSSATAYLTAGEFIARYDARFVGMLVRDDDGFSNATALATDPNLAAILADASGQVESACLAGQRYAANDLASLTGVSLQYLKRLVADLAIGMLRQRRGKLEEGAMPQYTNAVNTLDQLRRGERIFSFAEVESAGRPTNSFMTDADFQNLNLVTNNSRFFGIRQNRRRFP